MTEHLNKIQIIGIKFWVESLQAEKELYIKDTDFQEKPIYLAYFEHTWGSEDKFNTSLWPLKQLFQLSSKIQRVKEKHYKT